MRDPQAGTANDAEPTAETSAPLTGDASVPVVLVEPDLICVPDRTLLLTEARYRVTTVRDVRELFFLQGSEPFQMAVLSDLLGPFALMAAAQAVRRHWPKACILVLGCAALVLEDNLYDETLSHSCGGRDFLEALARLVSDPWGGRANVLPFAVSTRPLEAAAAEGSAAEGSAADRESTERVPIPARRELPFRDGSEGHDGPRRVRQVLA